MKKRIGKLIPYSLIKYGRRAVHFGLRRCIVCRGRVRRFSDSGYGFPVLERLQVVGGLRRPADRCPLCHSTARERLIWYWLTRGGQALRFEPSIRIAHFAPEKGLSGRLLEVAPDHYDAYDIEPGRYRHLDLVQRADLHSLPMESGSVDLLICNHVLEHVPDPQRAMREIGRVLAASGVAILQVPIALDLDQTIELGADSTPAEREDRLGQDDHLRLWTAPDYIEALNRGGLAVHAFDAFDDNAALATQWQLDPFEKLFVCSRQAEGTEAA